MASGDCLGFFGGANWEYWPSKDLEFAQICTQVL
jgi:hypothetical protein